MHTVDWGGGGGYITVQNGYKHLRLHAEFLSYDRRLYCGSLLRHLGVTSLIIIERGPVVYAYSLTPLEHLITNYSPWPTASILMNLLTIQNFFSKFQKPSLVPTHALRLVIWIEKLRPSTSRCRNSNLLANSATEQFNAESNVRLSGHANVIS